MRLPVIRGMIKRRLLVNFRAAPKVVQDILPEPFHPKLHSGQAIVGVCLIRLERIRPAGLPGIIGFSSENAAHRIAVEWKDPKGLQKEGAFIPRRDTDALLNRLAGGRLFPGEHNAARFSVMEQERKIDLSMESVDGKVSVKVVGEETDSLPSASCFSSLAEDPKGLQKEGAFIPRRDTDALLNRLAGGRLFPGEHNAARRVVKRDRAFWEQLLVSEIARIN